MKLHRLFLLLLLAASSIMYAQEAAKDWNLLTMLNYEYVSIGEQRIHFPTAGIMFNQGMNSRTAETQNTFSIAGIYTPFIAEELKDDYSNLYHTMNIIADKRINRHSIFGIILSESDKPFYGGTRSFIAAAGYGYEFIRKENISLLLGANAGFLDLGIEIDDEPFPFMILPRVAFNMKTSWMHFSATFLNKPIFDLTFLPESKIRLITNLTIPLSIRDVQDLQFDTMIMYRPFSKDSKMGDFAGIGLGFKNGGFGMSYAKKDTSYDIVYNSIYGKLDISFFQFSAGYLFNGVESYDYDNRDTIDDGFFINAMLAWQF
jgi:hypothetical protein